MGTETSAWKQYDLDHLCFQSHCGNRSQASVQSVSSQKAHGNMQQLQHTTAHW